MKAGIEKSKKNKPAQDATMSNDDITDDMFVLCLNSFALIHVNQYQ